MKTPFTNREETIKAWVAALRSGEYIQGTGALNDNNKFCCLGVLCDLERKAGGRIWRSYVDGLGSFGWPEYRSGDTAVLPDDLKEFIFKDLTGQADLIEMNDQGVPFSVIADKIEKELL